jgi:ATP adenylyltransferase
MDHLWSPWRMEYILSDKSQNGCVFCEVLKMEDCVENLIIHRGKTAYVILNRFPYNTGHALVIPYQHVPTYEALSPAERAEMMELLNTTTIVLRNAYHPEAFNIGANIGAAAGAGIAPHVHFHIMPRWNGDTNFLTTISQTRIVPEDLCTTWNKVKQAWDDLQT